MILYIQMLPTVAYADNPATSFTTKFVHPSTNKVRCSINRVLVILSASDTRIYINSPSVHNQGLGFFCSYLMAVFIIKGHRTYPNVP